MTNRAIGSSSLTDAVTCRIRDLNDEINKLIREKGHWERRIVELGGPNYAKSAPRLTDDEGNQVQGATGKGGGYKYFGAAKQLPGVRELFEKEAPRQIRRTRHQMYRHIDADYYGFRDDEDGVLEKVEAPAEKRMRAQVCLYMGCQQPAARACMTVICHMPLTLPAHHLLLVF